MNRKYPVRSDQTLAIIQQLLGRGITRIAAIVRHSERFYSTKPGSEPFMGLTPAGMQSAMEMGQSLPASPLPRLHSSLFGRCIETAYLIDKGFSRKHGVHLAHNQSHELLAPFYIKNVEKALVLLEKNGAQAYIRNWFDNRINREIMENPTATAAALTTFMLDRIADLKENEIAVCVSHDWNIFPLKEFVLGLTHEDAGDVGYLDGVVFFEQNGQAFATSFQTDPQPVDAAG